MSKTIDSLLDTAPVATSVQPRKSRKAVAKIHVDYRQELQELAIEAIGQIDQSPNHLLSKVMLATIADFLATKDRGFHAVTHTAHARIASLPCHLFMVEYITGSLQEHAEHRPALYAQLRGAHEAAMKLKETKRVR